MGYQPMSNHVEAVAHHLNLQNHVSSGASNGMANFVGHSRRGYAHFEPAAPLNTARHGLEARATGSNAFARLFLCRRGWLRAVVDRA
jgi:hypothetical protein